MDIVIDCDDVLFDLSHLMFDAIYQEYGIDLSNTKIYNVHETLGVTLEEFFRVLTNAKVLENSKPNKHAKALVDGLHSMGFTLHMVTARGWHHNAEAITKAAMEEAGIHMHGSHFLVPNQSKADYINRLSVLGCNFFAIIDDNYKHAFECVDSNATKFAVLPRRSWNNDAQFHKHTTQELFWVDDLLGALDKIRARYIEDQILITDVEVSSG